MNIFGKAKEKVTATVNKVTCSKTGMALASATVITAMVFANPVFAVTEGEVQNIVSTIIKIISVLIIASGLFTGIFGAVHYAEANGDGDGPAKSKAMKQISAGIMLLVMSIILFANAKNLAGMIGTSI